MLEFKQTDTAAEVILTLTEFETINDPYYLFVFTHVLTKDVVAFIKSQSDDESSYPVRYNQFTIDPTIVFAAAEPGEWHYEIHEQPGNTNLDPLLSGAILEYGKLIIDRDPEFAFEMYDSQTSFKTYNG